jgi:hypothetical protein
MFEKRGTVCVENALNMYHFKKSGKAMTATAAMAVARWPSSVLIAASPPAGQRTPISGHLSFQVYVVMLFVKKPNDNIK